MPQIKGMDRSLYCVLLLAQMKNGKLQVASNYPEVGTKFITSELALRFKNCTNEENVFQDVSGCFWNFRQWASLFMCLWCSHCLAGRYVCDAQTATADNPEQEVFGSVSIQCSLYRKT